MKKYNILIRHVGKTDIKRLLEIESAAWNEGQRATDEMLLSRITTFPEGIFCAVRSGVIEGFAVNEIVNLKDFDIHKITWVKITDNGTIRRSHNDNGDSLYGVSISVNPNCADTRIAKGLYEYGGQLAIRKNLKRILLGSRIPKFYKYSQKMSVDEYVFSKTRTGRILDPELALYVKMGMRIEKILPNYFKDPESLDYGVLVSWENIFHRFTRSSKMLAEIASKIFKL